LTAERVTVMGVDRHKKWEGPWTQYKQNDNLENLYRTEVTKTSIKQIPWSVRTELLLQTLIVT